MASQSANPNDNLQRGALPIADVMEAGSPVSNEYGPNDNAFNGTIKTVRLDGGIESHDYLHDPKHLMNVAMIKQ